MKLEIKERKRNPLMKREDVVVRIDHEGKATPARLQVMEEVAKLLKTKKENLVVNRIITAGGSTVSETKVFSYSRKDDIPEWRLKKMEARMSKAKGEPKAAEKPGEVLQEAQKEEAPAEDKGETLAGEAKPEAEESPKEEPEKKPAPEGEAPQEAADSEKPPEEAAPKEEPADKKEETKPSSEGTSKE